MSTQVEVLEKKYQDLRMRIVSELDRVEGRLEFYAAAEKESQTAVMEKKYIERRDRLFEELDKVDSRLQSYASMKKTITPAENNEALVPQKSQKMYRGRPVA